MPSASRRGAVPAIDRAAGELKTLDIGAGGRHGVRDEEDAAGRTLGAERDADRRRVDMDAIGNEAGMQGAQIERGPDDARLAVAKLALGVEQMGHHGGAGLGGRLHRGVGMRRNGRC